MNDSHIPPFEGHPVDGTAVKVTGAVPLDDLSETVLGIDDMVQMISMFKVVGIHHQIEKSTGKLVRVQTLRPIEMALHPLDDSDPADDGIIRALPTPVQGQLGTGDDDD